MKINLIRDEGKRRVVGLAWRLGGRAGKLGARQPVPASDCCCGKAVCDCGCDCDV